MELEKIFCELDDFCKEFEKNWQQELLSTGEQKRQKKFNLCLSEVMTIIIHFHQSSYRNFKDYYPKHVCIFFQKYFPNLVMFIPTILSSDYFYYNTSLFWLGYMIRVLNICRRSISPFRL